MKRLSIIIYTFFLVLTFQGCSDYLDVEPKDQETAGSFYKTAFQMDQAVNGLYGTLRPMSTYMVRMSEFRSDNYFPKMSSNPGDDLHVATFNGFNLLSDGVVEECWSSHYRIVATANMLLDKLGDADFLDKEVKVQYEAEARFIRALAYFQLVRFFGNVPVSTTALTPDEAFATGQSTEAEVYDNLIVPDLQYAVEHLSETAFDYQKKERKERVSLYAAKALLGKVYLTMAGFPLKRTDTKVKAATLLKEVLDYSAANGDKYWAATMNDWNHMWTHEQDNKYFIFEIQYINSLGNGNPAVPYTAPTINDPTWCTYRLVAGPTLYAEQSLLKHFIDGDADGNMDLRAEGTVNTASGTVDDEGNPLVVSSTSHSVFFVKFFESKKKRAALGLTDMDGELTDRTCWPQNWPVLRLEDVMLMYAECAGRDLGLPYVNKIRTRAGLNPINATISEADFQTAVQEERRWELCGEGERWFDLVRQNTYVQTMKNMFTSGDYDGTFSKYADDVTADSYLYPIPQSQMNARKGLYKQNNGY